MVTSPISPRGRGAGRAWCGLITARVQRQVAGLFVAEDCGTQTLKGVPEPTAPFARVVAGAVPGSAISPR